MTTAFQTPAYSDDGLSPHQQAERDQMLVDFRFFCKKLKIRYKAEREGDESLIGPFIWNEAQEIVWAWMCAQMKRGMPVRLVILKARQFGISTFFCAWIFWWCWRKSNIRALLSVQQKGTTMSALMETLDRFYQSFPEEFRPQLRQAGAKRISKDELYFNDRKSGMLCVAADKKDSARGDSTDLALCTEVGSYARAKEFFGEFRAQLGERRETTLILESTAAPGYFRERYMRGKEQSRSIFIPYSCVPSLYSRKLRKDTYKGRRIFRDAQTDEIVTITAADRKEMDFLSRQHERINEIIGKKLLKPVTEEQIYWWHWYCEHEYDGDEEWMRQEFPRDDVSAFERSVASAFRIVMPIIRETVEDAPQPMGGELEALTDLTNIELDTHKIEFMENESVLRRWTDDRPRNGIVIWRLPVKDYVYTVGVDVADDIGTAADPDDACFSVISVYCCNTREQVAEWRGSMDPHELGDEVAKVGYFYNTALVNVEYNNMGVTTVDRLVKYLAYPNRFKWPIFDEAGKLHKKKEMWVTDERTKQIMIGSLRYAIKNALYKVRSAGLQEELLGYQSKDGYYEAGPDTYADRIVAAALAWQGVEQTDYGAAQVLGALPEPDSKTAEGAAARFVNQSTRSPFDPAPRSLPDEFDEELRPQTVEDDDWIFGGAKAFA